MEVEMIQRSMARGAAAVLLAATAVASFYGELRSRGWRHAAHAGLVVMLAAALWTYWPKA